MNESKSNQMIDYCHEHGISYKLILRTGCIVVYPLREVNELPPVKFPTLEEFKERWTK